MRCIAGMLSVVLIFSAMIANAQDRRRAPSPVQEECPQGRQLRAQKNYPAGMSDCEILDADTAAENKKLSGNSARQPQPPALAAPKVDLAKQRANEDLKLGYPSLSFEDFALDNKTIIHDEKKIAIEGFYHKSGNVDELYAGQVETIPSVSSPASHIIPILIENAPRDLRATFCDARRDRQMLDVGRGCAEQSLCAL